MKGMNLSNNLCKMQWVFSNLSLPLSAWFWRLIIHIFSIKSYLIFSCWMCLSLGFLALSARNKTCVFKRAKSTEQKNRLSCHFKVCLKSSTVHYFYQQKHRTAIITKLSGLGTLFSSGRSILSLNNEFIVIQNHPYPFTNGSLIAIIFMIAEAQILKILINVCGLLEFLFAWEDSFLPLTVLTNLIVFHKNYHIKPNLFSSYMCKFSVFSPHNCVIAYDNSTINQKGELLLIMDVDKRSRAFS